MKKTKPDNYKLLYEEINFIYKEMMEIKDLILKIENKIDIFQIIKSNEKNDK